MRGRSSLSAAVKFRKGSPCLLLFASPRFASASSLFSSSQPPSAPAGSGTGCHCTSGTRFLELPQKRRDDLRIELRPGAALELGDGALVRELGAVDAVGRHRVVGIGDEEDP